LIRLGPPNERDGQRDRGSEEGMMNPMDIAFRLCSARPKDTKLSNSRECHSPFRLGTIDKTMPLSGAPYNNISAWLTASHPNSEVKQVRAGVILRWGTTREGPVLRFFCCISFSSLFSFLFLKPSRFSLCSPSFYVPLSLGHMHMHECIVVHVVVVVVVVFTKFLTRNIWPTG